MAKDLTFFDSRYALVDKKLIEEGAPVDFGDGFIVTIRHLTSKKVDLVRSQKLQQMKIGMRNKELNRDQSAELTKHVLAHAVIVGWSGGDAPEFSPELALEVFDTRPEFMEDVITAATSYETFRKDLVEGAVGNSSTSSSGDSDTETSSTRSSGTKK